MPADSPSRVFLARARQRPAQHGMPDRGVATAERPSARDDETAPPAPVSTDVVIDLTGGPSPGGAVRPIRRTRWWLLALATVAIAAAVVAAVNYNAAMRWRDRAIAAEQLAAQSSAEAAAARSATAAAKSATATARQRRRAIAEQLAVSEADVAALEARVATLASDRAEAQDRGVAVATTSSDAQIRALQAQIDSCTAQIDAARVALVGDVDVASWQRALTAAQATCEQVAADVDALVSTAR